MSKVKYIIGVDEVGRGALAGPVTVAAVAIPVKFKIKKANLKDSKKLTSNQREIWFEYIESHPKIFCITSSVSSVVVDRINISRAANLAASRAVMSLIKKNNLKSKECLVYLDGGLFLDPKFNSNTVVKGDEKISVISLASIVAKVTRDRRMKKRNRNFPGYSFFKHKGYGTKKHFQEIGISGKSRIHRLSFLREK